MESDGEVKHQYKQCTCTTYQWNIYDYSWKHIQLLNYHIIISLDGIYGLSFKTRF